MHPKLEHYLNDYHAHEYVMTALRTPHGTVGWSLTRNSRVLTYDGWYDPVAVGVPDDVGILTALMGDEAGIEELRSHNRRQLARVLGFLWLLPDGELGPGLLADRASEDERGSWSADRLDREELAMIRSADPLAYLSLGSPDGLRKLADLVSR